LRTARIVTHPQPQFPFNGLHCAGSYTSHALHLRAFAHTYPYRRLFKTHVRFSAHHWRTLYARRLACDHCHARRLPFYTGPATSHNIPSLFPASALLRQNAATAYFPSLPAAAVLRAPPAISRSLTPPFVHYLACAARHCKGGRKNELPLYYAGALRFPSVPCPTQRSYRCIACARTAASGRVLRAHAPAAAAFRFTASATSLRSRL